MLEKIKFNGDSFPIRTVSITGWGKNLTIATEELQKCLLDCSLSGYTSTEAKYIDEQIFYYVKQNEINLSASQLVEFIQINL